MIHTPNRDWRKRQAEVRLSPEVTFLNAVIKWANRYRREGRETADTGRLGIQAAKLLEMAAFVPPEELRWQKFANDHDIRGAIVPVPDTLTRKMARASLESAQERIEEELAEGAGDEADGPASIKRVKPAEIRAGMQAARLLIADRPELVMEAVEEWMAAELTMGKVLPENIVDEEWDLD